MIAYIQISKNISSNIIFHKLFRDYFKITTTISIDYKSGDIIGAVLYPDYIKE